MPAAGYLILRIAKLESRALESSKLSNESHPRRDRRFSWTAIGFLFAFVLSVATVILTGLAVKAPGSHRQAPDAQAGLSSPSRRRAVTATFRQRVTIAAKPAQTPSPSDLKRIVPLRAACVVADRYSRSGRRWRESIAATPPDRPYLPTGTPATSTRCSVIGRRRSCRSS